MRPDSLLPVIYEDEDLLVLHKRSGIPSVPHTLEETGTAVHSALAHFPGLKNVGDKPLEPGALHRLDTGTSGLLAFAKNQAEFIRLREAWRKHEIRKIYRALVTLQTPPPRTPFLIDCPLAHDTKSAKRMLALVPGHRIHSNRIRGRPRHAITWVRHASLISPTTDPLAAAPHDRKTGDFEIEIETGVLHQIRCHLAAFQWPILGDSIYGKPAPSNLPTPAPKRLWLHAWKLVIPLKTGIKLTLQANLPQGWGRVL